MRDVLADDLKNLPDIYRIDLGIEDLFRCIEKVFGLEANYAKGQGAEFRTWFTENFPGEYLFPIIRACGGARQDLNVEGAPAVLMNLPYYLQFLRWRISAVGGKSVAILQTKLLIMLRCTEVIALLRVLSILHISMCLPTRWLAGKSHELADYDFGYYDMGSALDAMEESFEMILDNGELIFDEDFMMNQMFAKLTSTIDPFRQYLEFMFEEKLSSAPSGNDEDKVFPWDLLRAAVFYPSRADIMKTDDLCSHLAVIAATTILTEFRDTQKATHNYLSSIHGKYSKAVISEEQRHAGKGKEASTSIVESNFASATQSLKTYGTIRLDSAAAEGQTRTNNDFGRGHEQLINIKKSGTSESGIKPGLVFQLKPELVTSLFHSAKQGAPNLRKRHDLDLKLLNQEKIKKLNEAQLKELEKQEENYILSLDYFEIGISERRWKSVEEAKAIYQRIPSESQKLKAVKEQILIRKIGFGWLECGHKWSEDGYSYTSKELLSHLIDFVIPLEIDRGIPSEAPMSYSVENFQKYKLGTESALVFEDDRVNVKSAEEMKQDALEERQRREAENETDRQASLQPNVMPSFDDSLIGFPIEYLFEYEDDETDDRYSAWCDGEVVAISNEKTRMVEIKWNEKKVAPGDKLTSKHKLGLRKWNPKNPSQGAWRKFIGDPNA